MFKALKEKFSEISGYVISNPADIFYLTGFYSEDCLLVYSENPVLVTDSRYTVAAKISRVPQRIVDSGYIKGVIEILNEQNIKNVGIQEEHLLTSDYLALSDAGFTLNKTNGIFTSFRCSKTEQEIEKIKEAQNITDKAFTEILPFIKPGVTEKEIRAKLEYIMLSLGADGLAFETIVASGANGAKPHAVPSDKKVESGDFVTIDFGARKENYDSDMTRTVAVGEISKEMEDVYNIVLLAHEKGRDALKAGVLCKDADAAARKVIEEAGYGEYFTHSLGHGVGIEIHESPRLSKTSEDVLKVGDVVTVEPGIYIENKFGVRIENMYVITRDGYENLTVSDKKLIKL